LTTCEKAATLAPGTLHRGTANFEWTRFGQTFRKMKNIIKQKIFKILFNCKPYVYAGLYLLLIPIFALIYSLLPYQFYHSTAKYEYSVLNPIADEILKELELQIKSNYKTTKHIQSEKILDIESVSLNSLKSENGKFYVKCCYSQRFKIHESDSTYILQYGCNDISFNEKSFLTLFDSTEKKQRIYKMIFNENQNLKQPNMYFEDKFDEIFKTNNLFIPALIIDNSLNENLKEFALTIYGFPNSFIENYKRMFYFSSVTLTTLGFGDIVPVTNNARILISIEAILGVVLIGLFLNALSKRTE